MPLDPEARRVIGLIQEIGRPPLHTLSTEAAREAYSNSRAVLQPEPPEVAEVEDLSCPSPAGPVRLRRYRGAGTEAGAALPCLLFMHGGGWVLGDIESHDQVSRALANYARCCVVSVDYRLAPEHKFPAAVDDCAAALRFVASEAAQLRIDPQRIAVGGDSAGGNLAAALALMGRDGTVPAPGYQLLLYPSVDLAGTRAAHQRFTDGYPLVTVTMRWFIEHYLAERRQALDWRGSPLRAPSLAGVPPAYVMTVGHDPLVDEGIAYARRLDEEDVRVIHVHMADQIHGFLTMGRFISASDLALRQAAAALVHHWSRQD
jgi:acetyl esterase